MSTNRPSPHRTTRPSRATVFDWLTAAARKKGFGLKLYPSLARREDGFLRLPATLDRSPSAYEFVKRLQALEDGWNEQDPEPAQKIVLVPLPGVRIGRANGAAAK